MMMSGSSWRGACMTYTHVWNANHAQDTSTPRRSSGNTNILATHTLHLCLKVVLRWEGDELPSCNVQVHLDVLERWPTPWLGGPADLHQVLEPIRAGGGDGEAEGACAHTVDDGRVLKLLHGGAGWSTMVTRQQHLPATGS